jgi:hypothetical protein
MVIPEDNTLQVVTFLVLPNKCTFVVMAQFLDEAVHGIESSILIFVL